MSRATRVICKRRARRLFAQLIGVEELKDGQAASRKRRYEAARGLVKISRNEGGGAKVVARLFLKGNWRREEGIKVLLRLSDDELDEYGFKAIGHVAEPILSTKLLATVLNHTRESIFFNQCISAALTGGEGTAAILYLAITETRSFFAHVTSARLFSFCRQTIENEEQTSLKWYCGAKLVCMFLASPFSTEWKHSQLLQLLLPVFEGLVDRWMSKLCPGGLEKSKKDAVDADPSLLAMIAVCGDHLAPFQDRAALPLSSNLKPFSETLISLLHPSCSGPRRLNTDHGIALYILLAQPPQVVNLFSGIELSSIGDLFMDMVLHPWIFEIPTRDAVEKDMLKVLTRNLEQWCISGLCCLPGPTFETALRSALKKGIAQLNSPDINPYEPLGLVERLLWLSIMQPPDHNAEQIQWAL
ncbi:hypothetical protein FRC00_007478 [Tulasnella sp. 408]|nr:hypothetical protein FRC00_007478 [Tulasnella sp. 408]